MLSNPTSIYIVGEVAELNQLIEGKADKSELTELQTELDSKASTEHQHAISDVTGLTAKLEQKAEITDLTTLEQLLVAQIAQKAPSLHGHSIEQIEELTSVISSLFMELNDKASVFHSHVANDIGNLDTFVQARMPRSSTARSDTPPLNPFEGLIWHEIVNNVTGNLIETWVYEKGQWISLTKYSFEYWSPTSSITGSVSFGLPLNAQYNYLFKELSYHCLYGSGTVDSTNYWRVIFSAQPSAINFADSGAIPNNNNQSVVVNLNNLLVPSNGERVFLMFNKYGAAPGVRIGAQVKYHLVRK